MFISFATSAGPDRNASPEVPAAFGSAGQVAYSVAFSVLFSAPPACTPFHSPSSRFR